VVNPSAAAEPASRPRQLLSRQERQASILAAAATAFARAGFAATSMDDVAAEAGVTKLILYRHFASKEDLYRAVLAGVADRLRDEFIRGFNRPEGQRRGYAVRALLVAARENPDGFRLLTVHAAREPQFAALAQEFQNGAVGVALALIGDSIEDRVLRGWAARAIVAYLVDGVLAWLDVGEAARDEELVEVATEGMVALYLAWAPEGAARVGPRPD
jgi:AcrR family transcriptional regulator